MKYKTMKATIKGTTCEGEAFTENLEFTMIPPDNNIHYGTGYYMSVKEEKRRELIDVRYERTTDIEILADRYIKSYYGENAHKVTKQF